MTAPVSVDWAATLSEWSLRCPSCKTATLTDRETTLDCQACKSTFALRDGVAHLMDFDTRSDLKDFAQVYQDIRQAEGYTGRGSAHYRALPDQIAKEPDRRIWRIRRRSFAMFKRLLARSVPRGGKVLDLGSGNGWLSHNLAALGYRPMGMDINADPDDGLAALRHYDLRWPAVLTSFDDLPLAEGTADLAVFNGSLHYSTNIETTLAEVFRVLKPGGSIMILDTPIYRDPTSGAAMMEERRRHQLATHGLATNLDTAGYLNWAQIGGWSQRFDCRVDTLRPWYGVKWALRPVMARILGTREPASFALIALTKA